MQNILKNFSVLFIISIAIRIIDVVKNLIIASILGISYEADTFLALALIPDYLLVLLGMDSLKGVVNSEYSSHGNKIEVKKSLSKLFSFLLIIGLFIGIVLIYFRELIISLFLPGFEGEKFDLAVSVSVFILPIFMIKPVSALLFSYYNSQKWFYRPVIFQSLVTISILVSIAVPYYNEKLVNNISIGLLIGNFLYFLFLFFPVFKDIKFDLKLFKLDFLSKKILRIMYIMFAVVCINQIYLSSRNYFVSFFDDGAIASINYGAAIPMFISSLTFNVIFGVLLNNFSTLHAKKEIQNIKETFFTSINILIFIYTPVVIFLIVFAEQIISIVYARGNFGVEAIKSTVLPFKWECLALITYVLYIIPVAFLLASKNYKKYTIVGVSVYIVGIFLNYLISSNVGYYGVSIVSFIINGLLGIVLIVVFRNELFIKISSFIETIKILSIGIIIFIIQYLFFDGLFDFNYSSKFSMLLTLSYYFVIILLIYAAMSYIFKVDVQTRFIRKLYNKYR